MKKMKKLMKNQVMMKMNSKLIQEINIRPIKCMKRPNSKILKHNKWILMTLLKMMDHIKKMKAKILTQSIIQIKDKTIRLR